MPKSTKSSSANYEVGYRKPPKASQFRKGQSGNPSGRPRKQPTVADVVSRALNSKVRVREGDKVRLMTQLEAVLRKQLELAMKGDQKAAQLVVRIARSDAEKGIHNMQNDQDGTELTLEQQEQIVAELLELHGVGESGGEEDIADDAKP